MSAFPSQPQLNMLLREDLDVALNTITGGGNYTEIVFEVINWAESVDRLADLIGAAYRRNPRNLKFREFMAAYDITTSDLPASTAIGPDFTWQGPTDERTLQSFWRSEPELWDVGFLKRGIDQVAAVCRIERLGQGAIATGFLIAPDRVLTNYHVLAPQPDSDPTRHLPDISLHFGTLTAASGHETAALTRQLAAQPILKASPTQALDYVLLQLEPAPTPAAVQVVCVAATRAIAKNDSINLLQHPGGQTMKISLSSHGVTGIYPNSRVQYVSPAAVGSSGSPCFNDQWELVALHHAQVAGSFGVRCEGILFSDIYPEIAHFLA